MRAVRVKFFLGFGCLGIATSRVTPVGSAAPGDPDGDQVKRAEIRVLTCIS